MRREIFEAQAAAAGLPLRGVYIPEPCSNEQYERQMSTAVASAAVLTHDPRPLTHLMASEAASAPAAPDPSPAA